MTDDADRPLPGTSGGPENGIPSGPLRPRIRPRIRSGLGEAPAEPQRDRGAAEDRADAGAAADDATRQFRLQTGPAAADLPAQPSRWNAEAADGETTQAQRWNPDAPASNGGASGGSSRPELPDTEPTPVDTSLDGAPSLDGQPPTEAMAFETAVVPAVSPGGPVPRTAPGAVDPTVLTGVDALFPPGEFRDIGPAEITRPVTRPAGATVSRVARTRPSLTSGQRSLLWAAGVLVAILVLLALYSIGRRLPAMFAAPPTPVATATQTPTPTPEPVDPAAGPVAPGEHAWDELRGGECVEPYESAWQEDYTVVACDIPHAAQLLVRAQWPEDAAPGGAYPGFDELSERIGLLCTDPAVIDYDVARDFDDFVVEGAYAVSADEWDEGHTEYFCFLTRTSGEPLTGSVARTTAE